MKVFSGNHRSKMEKDRHILPKVVEVDPEKCKMCHVCVRVCPVKFANVVKGDHIEVNPDLCIGCGKCIEACPHSARKISDDTEDFFSRLGKEKMVAIVAPSAASNFPGEKLSRLVGFLKSSGIDAVFDVSFGAELSTRSYIYHIKNNMDKGPHIATPCPSVVTFVQIYLPELIPYLIPYHSPMLSTMIMIRRFFPEFSEHKIAVISPCIAKKREFVEYNLGDYNVTYVGLVDHLKKRKLELSRFPKMSFDGPIPDRGVLYPTPGGLTETAERELPGISKRVRRIEGRDTVFKYFMYLARNLSSGSDLFPLLIDCLGCESGCNGGPATIVDREDLERLDILVRRRYEAVQRRGSDRIIEKELEKYWEPELYFRKIRDLSHLRTRWVKQPSESEIERIFREVLLKESREDILNCHACGYPSCRELAIAIYNGINRASSCFLYNKKLLEQEKEALTETQAALEENLAQLEEYSASLEEILGTVQRTYEDSWEYLERCIYAMEKIVRDLRHLVHVSEHQKKAAKLVEELSELVDSQAKKIHILSINAAIEAAKAGKAGTGMGVLAEEIRKMAMDIRDKVSDVQEWKSKVSANLRESVSLIENVSHEGDKIANAILKSISRWDEMLLRVIDSYQAVASVAPSLPKKPKKI